ncbi:MAG: hypothetical protein DLM50_08400 [Candidatus Meridianibacter frigidus]|nr:MAG: hypothetical protein DLM50_08400 [Candidatus Eremiobacteraeota bacterium]
MPFKIAGRGRVKMRVERREMQILDQAQQRAFIRAARGNRLEALWVIALASGMREGEILGLRWAHIKGDHVAVLGRLDARRKAAAQTKTRASVRHIDLDPQTMRRLEAHRRRMSAEGHDTGPRDLVFVNTAGKAISASNLTTREFKPLLTKAGLPESVRFHDLRHSHATLLLSLRMNPRDVQARLGHESVRTTLDLYVHHLPKAGREAATLVGGVLFGKSP